MPNSYRVSIRVVPIINAGPESSSGYGLQNGLELKLDGQHLLKVRIVEPQGERGDGIRFISDPITYLDIDVEAKDKSHAVAKAIAIAHRFIALIAFVHKSRFEINLAGGVQIYLLPDMDNLGPFTHVHTASVLASLEELGLNWNKLNRIVDESTKSDLELALDWLYIGFVEHDDRTRFLAYWTCLELLLGSRTSSKVYNKVPASKHGELDADLQAVLAKYSIYLSSDDQKRFIDNAKDTETESPVIRWSKALETRDIPPLNGGEMEKELRKLYKIRNALTHTGGREDRQKLFREEVPVEEVKHLAMEYVKNIIHVSPEITETS